METIPNKLRKARFQSLAIAAKFYYAIPLSNAPMLVETTNSREAPCVIVFWLE